MTAPTAPSPGSQTESPSDSGTGELEQLDEARFEALYRQYRPTLVRFAARRNADDPEAAADLALFGYYRTRFQLRNRDADPVRSYLVTATANQVIDQHRRKARSVTTDELDPENDGEPMPAFDEDVVDAALLQELIAGLSPAQRDTILQRFYLDLTAEEAGQLQGREANAVHQLQHRAIGRLRKALLASLAVVLVLLVVWLTRGADPGQPVNTDPVDGQSTSTAEDQAPPGDDVSADARTVADEDPTEQTPEPTAANPTTSTSPQTLVDQPPADQPDVAAPDPAPSSTVPESTPPTAPPSTTTTTTVAATQGFNRCVVFAVGADRLVVTLFDPAGDTGLAASYRSPSTIRFITGAGVPVFEIATDGQGVDGDTSGSAGWLEFEDGVRTHQRYADASPPTEWGVLLDNSVPDNWTAVEYTNQQGDWVTAPTCNI